MTERETEIFHIIQQNPAISQNELAAKLNLARSSVAVHIANLQKKGYILGKGYIVNESAYVLGVGAANVDIHGQSDAPIVMRDSNPGRLHLSAGGVCRNICDNLCRLGLTVELCRRGWDIYGVDGSPEMLSAAMQKASEEGLHILFLCQKMQRIDLYGTVDTVVCTLDSINHLTSPQDVQRTFDRVSLFLNPGGYFIFDANTIYKHREVLGNNTFVYDTRNVYCVWQNTFSPSQNRITISLDFFHRDGNAYYRSQESFSERAYAREELEEMLKKAGLEAVEVFHEQSFEPPREASQRLVYAARKPMRK